MGLDVFFTTYINGEEGPEAPIDHDMNFPYLCGFHLWRDLDKTSPSERNYFAMCPSGLDFEFLPYGWHSDLSPDQVVEQRDALLNFFRSHNDHEVAEVVRDLTEAKSLLSALNYAVLNGYGTKADY